MRLVLGFLALLALAAGAPAHAQNSFDLPGLSRDSARFVSELQRRFPAGATPQQRAAAETRAAQAEGRRDWPAAIAAWEERLGMPDARPEMWLALGRAALARNPADPNKALLAAQQAFDLVPAGPPEIPSLAMMADALRRQERWVPLISVLEAIAERAPNDANNRTALAEARRQAGILLRRVRTEPESEPARACLTFTSPPARRTDWQPEDWVRTEPPIPGLAVTREEDEICLAGIPWGRNTRVVLRAGMPGEAGIGLRQDLPILVSMPDRQARIGFDSSAFILPRGGPARVAVATMNVPELELRLVRVTERNLLPLNRNTRLGDTLSGYEADEMAETWGRVVWQGKAEIPRFQRNQPMRTVLPLPDALTSSGPGLYALLARPTDPENRGSAGSAAIAIMATDIGLTAWRGQEGLAVQARSLGTARPKAGVRVALMARNNDVLAEADTGPDGVVRFPTALMRGEGPMAPVALHGQEGDDLVALDLETASFDLSDRGVTGRDYPGPVDAFLWLDRGIYRPGETVNVALLPRDPAGRPVDLPIRLRLRRPNGQIAGEAVPTRGPEGAIHWPVTLSSGAPVGGWTVEALTDPNRPPIARITFQVDAFVPERLEVKAGPAPGPLVAGTPLEVPIETRFLYGAPGAGLSGNAEMRISPDPEPFEAWRGWRFGLADEPLDGGLQSFDIPESDDQGRATLTLQLERTPDASRPLRGDVQVTMAEPGGRGSKASFAVPIRGTTPMIALRPVFRNASVDDGSEAAVEIALVSPSGEALSGNLRARLVRERPSWRFVLTSGSPRYETVWRDEPVDSADIPVAPGRPGRFARNVGFGRYRLEVTQPNGLAIASIRFRSGWTGSDDPAVPDKVDVAADRRAYSAGESARLRITPPFAGRASVAVLTDRLVSTQEVDVPADGAEVSVPVDPAWGPGAWVAVTVFRPGETPVPGGATPRRAIGLTWVGIDPAARTLEVAIETPDLVRPRGRLEVPVRVSNAAGPVHLTLAAVDEGILRLTRFQTPDPARHFLGRRRLGLDIRDDYGRLIVPPEGEAALLRQGGDDDMDTQGVQPPQRIVSLFSGIVSAGPDGRAVIPLDIPEFNGEIRLMAVAWAADRVGSGARSATVRDPIVAETLLPRFLAPGDEARLPILLHNLDQPAGQVVAQVQVEGPLAVDGGRVTADLAQGARALPFATLRATGAGEGVIRLAVTGPGGYSATHESRITLRSPRPLAREVVISSIAPNGATRVAPDLTRFYAGTTSVRATWGQPVRYDPAAMMRSAVDFPFACSEQVASRIMALSAYTAEEDRDARLNRYVVMLLDKQRYDGSLGLWSQQGEADRFVTAYGAEALLRARAAGATVPEAPLEAMLNALRQGADDESVSEPLDRAVQAYRLHVLAMAGRPLPGAARRLFEGLDSLPTPLSKAQLGAAFARMGDTQRAEAAFAAALNNPARRNWHADYGSTARDTLAVTLLLKESGLLPARLNEAVGRLPGPEFTPMNTSTQEQAWAVALASTLGRDGRPARVVLAGQPLPVAPVVTAVLTAPAEARNGGDQPLSQAVSVAGLTTQPQPAGREGMRITRRFFTPQGEPLNLDTLRQNQMFILQIEARSEDNDTHRSMIQQGLPAGWEIVGRYPEGAQAGMDFLGELTAAEAFPALDDRFAAAVTLSPGEPVARYAVRLRAVTAGRFELPGAEVRDMYRPTIFARQNSGRITVAPAQ
ncbi:MG2 domain-containing protein [Muricoccus radiodurans]|uniref:MG2 domain-containing protein n=1 Tax=Muricoccus radiodurans TaxID=2231721 RepID=UPI003CF3E6BD